MIQKCANCKFLLNEGAPNIWCRRFPPTATLIKTVFDASGALQHVGHWGHFPVVNPDNWCGEWVQGPKQMATMGEA